MKEFDLSKKIYDIDTCPIFSDERRVINVFHIKEFIRLLKEELNNLFEWGIETKNINPNLADEIIEKIDKLIGEKLC